MKFYIIICFSTMILASCKKDILDEKPDKKLVVPRSIQDYQALLDNTIFVWSSDNSGIMEVLSADHSVSFADVQSASQSLRNAYTWQADIYGPETYDLDWNNTYKQVYNANVVLDGLAEMKGPEVGTAAWNEVKGIALYFRANAFFILAQLYARPYQEAIAGQELGIPLRLSADFNMPTTRSSLAETYGQIKADLLEAANLLPLEQDFKTQPTKAAAYALLARVTLSMESYPEALDYAERSLAMHSELMDFNQLDSAARFPIPDMNEETLFFRYMTNYGTFAVGVCKMDATLVNLYQDNDLRKGIFFVQNSDGSFSFRAHYTASTAPFAGVATDEVYLIKAETLARSGETEDAMETLNTLLQKRWRSGTFVPLHAENADQALGLILTERRKELVFRGLRWQDLRRLNRDDRFAVTLRRTIDGVAYELPPNDLRYVQLIHPSIIALTGVQQNER